VRDDPEFDLAEISETRLWPRLRRALLLCAEMTSKDVDNFLVPSIESGRDQKTGTLKMQELAVSWA
jgi:hypothetical protein